MDKLEYFLQPNSDGLTLMKGKVAATCPYQTVYPGQTVVGGQTFIKQPCTSTCALFAITEKEGKILAHARCGCGNTYEISNAQQPKESNILSIS